MIVHVHLPLSPWLAERTARDLRRHQDLSQPSLSGDGFRVPARVVSAAPSRSGVLRVWLEVDERALLRAAASVVRRRLRRLLGAC